VDAGQFGNEIFTVAVTDGSLSLEFGDAGGDSMRWLATRIILTRLNAAPEAIDDAFETLEDESLFVNAETGLLSNDIDADNDNLLVNTRLAENPSNGSLTILQNGSFLYVPDDGFVGTDTFVYEVLDSNGFSDFATVTIEVLPAPFLLGDVNGDGVVNLLDVNPFVSLIGNGEFQDEADINGDGVVNLLDVGLFVKLLSGN